MWQGKLHPVAETQGGQRVELGAAGGYCQPWLEKSLKTWNRGQSQQKGGGSCRGRVVLVVSSIANKRKADSGCFPANI